MCLSTSPANEKEGRKEVARPQVPLAFPARALQMRLQALSAGNGLWTGKLPPRLVEAVQADAGKAEVVATPTHAAPQMLLANCFIFGIKDAAAQRGARLKHRQQRQHAGMLLDEAKEPAAEPRSPTSLGAPRSSGSVASCGDGSEPTSPPSSQNSQGMSQCSCTEDYGRRQDPSDGSGAVAATSSGGVWRLARDPVGCRRLQDWLVSAEDNEARMAIAHELRGHVWDAFRCPNGNHVLQRIISTVPPEGSQFIIDELMPGPQGGGGIALVVRHRYGCRIIERLLENCHPHQVRGLVEALLADTASICMHHFGNYVMQHLLEHGSEMQKRRLVQVLLEKIADICCDPYGRAVLGKALCCGPEAEVVALSRAVVRQGGAIVTLACDRHAHVGVQRMLSALWWSPAWDQAYQQLTGEAARLRASRYGRRVLPCLSNVGEGAAEE